MFSKVKLPSGGTLQEVMRSGRRAEYEYTPEGEKKATHRVKARSLMNAENKLINTGVITAKDYFKSQAEDIKTLTPGAKKPIDPFVGG